MKNKRDRKIRKLKRVHILPHILALVFFIFFFIFAIRVFWCAIFNYLVQIKMDSAVGAAQSIANKIESKNISDGDFENFSENNFTEKFFVTDADGRILVSTMKMDEDYTKDSYMHTSDGKSVLIYDENLIKSMRDSNIGPDTTKMLIDQFMRFARLGGNRQAEICKYKCYAIAPVYDGKYYVYLDSDIPIMGYDTFVLIFITLFNIVVVAVPVIVYNVILIFTFISRKKRVKLIYYDAFTGGKNWLYFKEFENKKLGRMIRKKHMYIASISFSKFKNFSACYGANRAENVIENAGAIIKSKLDKKEVFARYSEAEFGLIIAAENCERCERRLIDIVQELKKCDVKEITFNCGAYSIENGAVDVDYLYQNARLARRAAVQKNIPLAWFDEKMKEEQIWESTVEENMEEALNNSEFEVYLQPKYGANSRSLAGAEALIRWNSSKFGFVSPGRFIPIFEKNGFITKIDDYMLRKVAELQKKWQEEGKQIVPVSVNISRVHFAREDLAEHICEIVDSVGISREGIELELTESAFFEEKDALIGIVRKLKGMGFAISMDDFGTGFSSLNSLKDLPLDVLKLDAEFFRGSGIRDERGSAIVAATIQLAKSLGMKTVAEGIEEEEQVNFLAEKGCELIQGYYFDKPLPIEEFENRMNLFDTSVE